MMTKYEAEQMFREQILPLIRQKEQEYGGGPDYVMRREEWNNFTDYLCKDRLITSKQYDNWICPDCCNSPSERRERKLEPVRHVMEL